MDLKEKLVELLCRCAPQNTKAELCGEKITVSISQGNIADYLIAHGVTVQDASNEIKQLKNQVAALKKSNRNWRRKVQRMRNRPNHRKENKTYGTTI